MIPVSFTYKRRRVGRGGARPGRRARRGREIPGRRALAAAADEAAAGRARGASSTSAGSRDLSYITDEGCHVAIGALTRHHDLEHSDLLARELPLLAYAAGQVGDPQIRHRGTIGGSLAHADPASDLPAVLLALDATLVARGADGSREIPIGEFFQGLFETALEPGELLTEIRVPKPAAAGWSFQKFTQRAIDWAIVGVAVQGGGWRWSTWAAPRCAPPRWRRPWRAGRRPPTPPRTPRRAPAPPPTSARAASYREHLARVLVSRALTEAASRA